MYPCCVTPIVRVAGDLDICELQSWSCVRLQQLACVRRILSRQRPGRDDEAASQNAPFSEQLA